MLDQSDYPDYDDDMHYLGHICRHNNLSHECDKCDEELGDIDKCLNCGRYKSSSQLDENQVCRIRCVNPNEY